MGGAAVAIVRVLVASINFHPDHSGIALYSTDCPVFLAEQGDVVTVVTGFSYYPSWCKNPRDRGRLLVREEHRGVTVLRGYLYVPSVVTAGRRMLHELSFLAFAALNLIRAGRHEVVIVFSPPLLLGLLGLAFARLWRAKLVVNVQDFQPDAALALGMIRPSPLTRLLLRVERYIDSRADLMASISPAMRDRLVEKGASPSRTLVWPNWIDIGTVAGQTHGRFRAQHPAVADQLLLAYAGNIGIKQGLDALVALAAALRDERRLHFFLIGEGADRDRILALARREGLRNLTYVPFLDGEAYADMLADVDMCFIGQRPGTGNLFFPSKLLGIMAMGKPLVVAADTSSELAVTVAEQGCGVVAAPNDIGPLADELRSLIVNPNRRRVMSENARRYVARFDRAHVLGAARAQMISLVAS